MATKAMTLVGLDVHARQTHAERAHNPGLDPGRVDVIVGGVLIAACVMRHWGFDEMLVSESDILDGVALSLAQP